MKKKKEIKEMIEHTYSELTECYNCGAWGQNEIPKGIRIDDWLRSIPCPHCGCKEIGRRRKVMPMIPNEGDVKL